jgi:hypothetical protein
MVASVLRAACIVAAIACGAASAAAQEVVANDSWTDLQPAGFQAGFVAGEVAAVRLVPTGPCPCPLSSVRFLFGGASSIQTVRLYVWEDGVDAEPGAEIFADDFEIGGLDEAMLEIDLSDRGISVSGPFRVGLGFSHDGLPSIARDVDGLTPGHNFILASGLFWVDSGFLGLEGDWIIRAVVGDVPPTEPGVLANDGWSSGRSAGFQGGFVAGEIAAVRLVPDEPCPCPLSRVRFLFGGAPDIETVTLRVWDDGAGTDAPGTLLFSDQFEIGGIDEALLEIDLAGRGVVVDGPFRVGLEFSHAGLPSVARDDDGTVVSSRNFVFDASLGWIPSSLLGVSGDWVIRALIGEQPPVNGELRNDGWFTGETAGFQGGFVPGEIAAARIVPSDPSPAPLARVRLLFGGAPAIETITLHVWDDAAGTAAPGGSLFSGDFEIGGIDEALLDVDLRAEGIVVDGPFRVGVEVHHAGLPSVARDADGTIAPNRNFVFDSTLSWVEAGTLGILGDWVLRAVLGPDPLPAELHNDLWLPGGPAHFAAATAGETVAARLVPTGACPCPVESARLLFGGAPDTEMITLHLWDDSAGTAEPGALLFSGTFPVDGDDGALQEIDLSAEGIVLSGPVRVGVELAHDGLPSVGRDDDGVTLERNFVASAGSWEEATAQGQTGDWVVRLVVPEPATPLLPVAASLALACLARRRRRSAR